jgi:Domain of unknown function (DUF222)/HNH endonuclease
VSSHRTTASLIEDVRRLHQQISSQQRELLASLAALEEREAWLDDGARDMAHWVSMQLGVSYWKASRWLAAGAALRELPQTERAFESGDLSIDKVVELTRLATPSRERGLIAWAERVSSGAIRRRADLENRIERHEVQDAEESRAVSWWYFDEGRRFALEAELPASAGARVARALDRLAGELPQMPDADSASLVEQRRADALVLLCGGARAMATDDADRTTVVIHTKTADGAIANGQLEGGGVVPSQTLERLLCNSRVQVVEEDDAGNALAMGRRTRIPSGWMARQVRYRDQECRFPGCGARRFTEAHHIVWWSRGGRTDLENLLLICSFHHKLVHEHGWVVKRAPDGDPRWFRPDGTRYRAGPDHVPISA